MSKFVQNKLSRKINSVAADLCSYSTVSNGGCQDAGYTRIIDRVVSTLTGIEVKREIMWGDAAAPSIVYPCRVATGYTANQVKLAYAVLDGLAELHSKIGQAKFNTTLFALKLSTRDTGWQQELADRKARWLVEADELKATISAGEQKLAERTAEYRRCPTDNNRWRMKWAADDIQGNKWRLEHIKEAIAGLKTPETVIAHLRKALIEQGILPA